MSRSTIMAFIIFIWVFAFVAGRIFRWLSKKKGCYELAVKPVQVAAIILVFVLCATELFESHRLGGYALVDAATTFRAIVAFPAVFVIAFRLGKEENTTDDIDAAAAVSIKKRIYLAVAAVSVFCVLAFGIYIDKSFSAERHLFLVYEGADAYVITQGEYYALGKGMYEALSESSEGLFRVYKDELFGFRDDSMYEVVAPTYEDAYSFSEGLAAVCKDGRWGYIGKNGDVAIPLNFDWAGSFKNEAAPVKSGTSYFLIDKSGNAQSAEFEYIFDVCGDYFGAVEEDSHYIIDSRNGEIRELPSEARTAIYAADDTVVYDYLQDGEMRYCLIDIDSGQKYLDGTEKITIFNNGVGFAEVQTDEGAKWRMIDHRGNSVSEELFENIIVNSEEYPAVAKKVKNGSVLWGFIDFDGEQKIDCAYEKVGGFKNGFAAVYKNGKAGVIDTRGKMIIKPKYDYISAI